MCRSSSFHDVYFDFDKSTLRSEGKAALDKALTVIRQPWRGIA